MVQDLLVKGFKRPTIDNQHDRSRNRVGVIDITLPEVRSIYTQQRCEAHTGRQSVWLVPFSYNSTPQVISVPSQTSSVQRETQVSLVKAYNINCTNLILKQNAL